MCFTNADKVLLRKELSTRTSIKFHNMCTYIFVLYVEGVDEKDIVPSSYYEIASVNQWKGEIRQANMKKQEK